MDEQRINYLIQNALVEFVKELRHAFENEEHDQDYRVEDIDQRINSVLIDYELKHN